MAFELPSVPFPRDPVKDAPYIASPDASGKHAVGSGQYFKNASNLWIPVSATDPLPTIEAELRARIGEVQDAPTANTLLARIKSLETKIDAIIAGTSPAAVQLTGSSLSETQALPIYGKSIEEIILFNAVAVADTNLRSSPLVDFRKYQKVIIESVTTLDQMIDLWFLVAGKWGYMLVNDTWTRNNITKVTIPTIGGGGTYLWPIDIRINEQTIFYLQATTAPTTGSITVKAWGVPN